jgi:integrase
LSQAASIIADACKLVEAAEIVPACRAWRDTRPNKIAPKKVDEAVGEFLARRKARVSERRYRSDECYLGIFSKAFSSRWLHGVTTLEIKDWLDSRGWMPKTKNDAACLVRLLYSEAMERNHAVENPARIKCEKIKASDVEIFSPEQVERMLNAVEDELKPFLAVTFFSGLRKEEASRLSVFQVQEGLKAGAIFLPGSCAKTGRGRSVMICDNLRSWLQRYLPVDGPLLPVAWSGMKRLDDLPRYVERRSGVTWKRNAARHSFGTYHLRLTGDPAETTKQMGNSLAQLDKHYNSRADSVTPQAAAKYFGILPSTEADNLIPMPKQEAASEPASAAPTAETIPSRQQSNDRI